MRVPIILLIILLLVLNRNIYGQVKEIHENKESFKHSIWIGAGFTTGFGLSYRFLPKKLGVQTTLLILPDNYYSSIGITILYKLNQRQNSWFYFYQSNLYSTYRTSGFDCGCPYYEWFNGVGFGVEIAFGKRIGVNFMGGMGFYESFEELTVTGETGLYYKF
jgi:hypothetical protein